MTLTLVLTQPQSMPTHSTSWPLSTCAMKAKILAISTPVYSSRVQLLLASRLHGIRRPEDAWPVQPEQPDRRPRRSDHHCARHHGQQRHCAKYAQCQPEVVHRASDTVGVTIIDGVNTDGRFNACATLTCPPRRRSSALKSFITLTDSDTESNTVFLASAATLRHHHPDGWLRCCTCTHGRSADSLTHAHAPPSY